MSDGRSILWRIGRLAGIAAGGYAVLCMTMCTMQARVIYPRHMVGAPSAAPPADVVVLERDFDGGRTHAWLAMPERTPAPLVVFCHGNAELIDDNVGLMRWYQQRGVAVLMPEYRGYGHAGGSPTQAGITEDVAAFVEQTLTRDDIDAQRVVYHGRSLGGGIVADLITRRKPAAMILQSTFTSVTDMAHESFVPGFFVRHPYRNDKVLTRLDVPVLIMHGTRDDIIPVSHGRELADLAPRAKLIEFDCGHNDFPGRGNMQRYHDAIESFLRDNEVLTPRRQTDPARTAAPVD